MPIELKKEANGQLRPYTSLEIAAMGIKTRGVKDGSHPTETRRVGTSTTGRKWFCNWEERWNFLVYMLGAVAIYDDSGTDRLTRLPPQGHPDSQSLWCASLESMTGHKFIGDDANGMPEYEQAECVFQYDVFPFNVKPDDETPNESFRYWQTLPSQHDVQYLTLPGGILKYIRSSGAARPHGIPIPYSVGIPQGTSIVNYKWNRLPFDAWGPGTGLYTRVFGDVESGTRGFVGTVNHADFLNREAGTMLFIGVEEELRPSVLGEGLEWDLTMKWLHKQSAPHNYFYFFETLPDEQVNNNNGWYFVGRGENSPVEYNHYTSDLLPDDYSLFNSRNHMALLQVAAD